MRSSVYGGTREGGPTLAPMPRETDAACPACGGQLSWWCTVPSSEPRLGDVSFELARCVRCGTAVTLGNAPPELHESGAYGQGSPRLSRLAMPLMRIFDRQRLALLGAGLRAGMSVLDVGAGRGRFVLSARRAGLDARGIEPSARGLAAATRLGVEVAHAGIEDAPIAECSLDAITLWHVLEHLDDPGQALARMHGWLRPGGALLVGVPNLASVQALVGGECWYHLDVPRHRVHFTPRGLEELLRAHGFAPVRVHHLLLEHNPFGMWQSLVNRLTRNPSYLYNLLKRNAPTRSADLAITLLALPLVPLAAVVEYVSGLRRRGGTIALLARRLP